MAVDTAYGFHPLVSAWFSGRYGKPTPVQAEAWPAIARGEHILALAPTGSGKTLTAFLGALSRFADGSYPAQGLSVLYLSPLKALNEDVRRNLVEPARELGAYFAGHGEAFPFVRVATRSGDTSQAERRRMLADPPSILCTTPESLFILLSSRSGAAMLSSLRLVVVDEIHALLSSKRGTSLAASLGRLALLAGEFQRVGLSATLREPAKAASFLGGARLLGSVGQKAILTGHGANPAAPPRYEERPVRIIAPPADKRYELAVLWPAAPVNAPLPFGGYGGAEYEPDAARSRYTAIVRDLAPRLARESGVLAFADSRRRAERLAALMNDEAGEGSAWAHHGSLSKDIRRAVELRLKEGRLPCIVATSSLELGVDLGSIGLVALAGSPSRADQALQRLGRAGHSVGLASRGILYPFHPMDILTAAALAGAVADKDVDGSPVPKAPLDVLAQLVLSMTLFEERDAGGLYDEIRSFAPYRELLRADFDSVLSMLAGRIRGSRVKELKAWLSIDDDTGRVKARDGAAMLLYGSGGAIPDRGYYSMRLAGSWAKLGELDEEFVFERRVGNSFSMGAQAWRITAITDEAVEVTPLERAADFMPFWKAEKASRGASVASRMLELCALFGRDEAAFGTRLRKELGLDEGAALALERFLSAQSRAQGGLPLPSDSSVVLELYVDPERRHGAVTAFIHSLRGLSVNEPLAIALSSLLAEELGVGIERMANDDSACLLVPLSGAREAGDALLKALRSLADKLQTALRAGVEASAAFGAAFRENAGRALLLPRGGFGKRSPLWITRLRAKRLYERIKDDADFPAIKESWKTVLDGRYDLPSLAGLCADLASGAVAVHAFTSELPSPFAQGSGWAETNRYLYEGDELAGGRSRFSESSGDAAIAAAMGDAGLRPILAESTLDDFTRRLRREDTLWAPDSIAALLDWVDERVCVPDDEWALLLQAAPGEVAREAENMLCRAADTTATDAAPGPLARLRFPGASQEIVCHKRRLSALRSAPGELLADWLAGEGIVPLSRVSAVFGLSREETGSLARDLEESGRAVLDGEGFRIGGLASEPALCHTDTLEALLRLSRKAARPLVKIRPAGSLVPFLAYMQGLGTGRDEHPGGETNLHSALSSLSGYPAPAGLWEREILPARLPDYRPETLDELLGSGNFLWFSMDGMLSFCGIDEWELFYCGGTSDLIPPLSPPRDFWALKEAWNGDMDSLVGALWREADAALVSSDGFEALRKRVESGAGRGRGGMRAAEQAESQLRPGASRSRAGARGRIPLALRDRWKHGPPLSGRWFSLALAPLDSDEADELDAACARARVALRRYGVLSRGILARERALLGWSALFPALRRLELAGELVSGRFFDELEGLQFMSAEAFELFTAGAEASRLWSVSAMDPASPCGLYSRTVSLPPGYASLPARARGNRLAFKGGSLAWAATADCRDLAVMLGPDDPDAPAALEMLKRPKTFGGRGAKDIVIRTVNGEAAAESSYAAVLKAVGFESDRGSMRLW